MLGFLTNDNIPSYITLAVLCGWFFIQYLKKDNKISQNDIANIKENLTNHVTDTDKKIDKLDTKIDKLDAKLDTKIDKIDTKLDTNFNRLNQRLDQAFGHSNKDNISK